MGTFLLLFTQLFIIRTNRVKKDLLRCLMIEITFEVFESLRSNWGGIWDIWDKYVDWFLKSQFKCCLHNYLWQPVGSLMGHISIGWQSQTTWYAYQNLVSAITEEGVPGGLVKIHWGSSQHGRNHRVVNNSRKAMNTSSSEVYITHICAGPLKISKVENRYLWRYTGATHYLKGITGLRITPDWGEVFMWTHLAFISNKYVQLNWRFWRWGAGSCGDMSGQLSIWTESQGCK